MSRRILLIGGIILGGLVLISFLLIQMGHPAGDEEPASEDGFPDGSGTAKTFNARYETRVWKNVNVKVLRISCSDICNDKEGIRSGDTCLLLREFFAGCRTPLDFYQRINSSTQDAQIIPDIFFCFSLEKLVSRFQAGDTNLWCTQQCMLLVGGIKAVFSHWDDSLNRYVLNDGCGDFRIQFWESCDDMIFPYFPLHSQVVIDMWNGDETPMGCERLEIDCWSNYIGEWQPWDHRNCGITSIMYTEALTP
ncbi:MAG: hypothetical protein PHZ19_02695 [Candidatus Thermoplasmatota archaeon]|nr:hypothetical protein [Candidatus Thermoplasmatota archaeon]